MMLKQLGSNHRDSLATSDVDMLPATMPFDLAQRHSLQPSRRNSLC